ncbi:hypothetical protein OG453_41070 [Streptomyces sp. NBC_01381]|uniref:hypothetical protein n=1 Tax=Streptomyces sp. NBC_01381 TaxID=2903845 RepID=UPI00225A360A|nr:hypothetical protein [Streptomyces sp. NBC_01381]MCX4672963.1 hypothetical protein [Streptomyces sp. NBC_01381]
MRQRRHAGRLTDPLGTLIARARTAGFRYLQHTVIVHGHAVGASLWLGHKSIKTAVDIVPIEQLHTAAESAVLERPDKC